MTYPPANPGYPAPQQPGGYGAPAGPAPTAGAGKAPAYLTVGIVLLGLGAYLASFGPLLSINAEMGPFGGAEFTASGLSYWTVAALVAALLAAVGLLPRAARSYTAVVAVAAVLGLLLVIGQVVNRPSGVSVGWALWLVLLFTLLQAGAAVTALLFETGVLTAPAPRPRYDQYGQYGPTPGGYYPGVQAPQQRPGYPAQYPGYPVAGAGAAGGYTVPDTSAPDTPPTGFPSYTPPPADASQQPSPAADPSAEESGSASGSSQP
ncbi:MAG: DUF5336 domain-containing protein [Mycobacterium sp.]|nr:DUF5336 domain-containing protein [Mycobacterium sp.]